MSARLIRMMLAAVVAVILMLVVFGALDWVSNETGPSFKEGKAKSLAVTYATALQGYKMDYEQYPHGTPAEIMHVLRGNNIHKMIYYEAAERDFNVRGELIDPWGTPYRIEFGDYPRPHVSSAGKNKVFDGDAEGSDDICSWR